MLKENYLWGDSTKPSSLCYDLLKVHIDVHVHLNFILIYITSEYVVEGTY